MKKFDNGGQATPTHGHCLRCGFGTPQFSEPGETWLDRMAGRVIQGYLSNCATEVDITIMARLAYRIAQTMLLEKRRLEKDDE